MLTFLFFWNRKRHSRLELKMAAIEPTRQRQLLRIADLGTKELKNYITFLIDGLTGPPTLNLLESEK